MFLVRACNDEALKLAGSKRPADVKTRDQLLKLAATYRALADEIFPPPYPDPPRPKDPPPFELES
jgi:hypothetical protein